MSRNEILNSASKFTNVLKQTPLRTNPPGRAQVPDRAPMGQPGNWGSGGSKRSTFPVKLTETNSQDNKWFLRSQLVDPGTGMVPGVGQAVVPEEYFQYAEQKEDENFYGNFKAWIMENSDLSTPESADYWFKTFPFIKDLKFAEIEREAELQKSLAKIAAAGPESTEDWVLLYMLRQGMVTPRDVPLHKLNEYLPAFYQKGLFSLFNYVPVSTAPIVPFTDPLGSTTPYGTPQFPYPSTYYNSTPANPSLAQRKDTIRLNVARPN